MTTFGSRPSITSIAERNACTMVMEVRAAACGVPGSTFTSAAILDLRGLVLPAQVLRHLLVDVLEHRGDRRDVAVEQRAVALGLLLRRRGPGPELGLRLLVLVLRPGADGNEMRFQPLDRIAQ